jgi:hypothetical protein
LYEDVNEYKKGHQPRTKVTEIENFDIVGMFSIEKELISESY